MLKKLIPSEKSAVTPGTGMVMVPMKYRALVLQLFKNEARGSPVILGMLAFRVYGVPKKEVVVAF